MAFNIKNAKVFAAKSSNNCAKIQFTKQGPRLMLGQALLDAIGNPKNVQVYLLDEEKKVGICKADSGAGFKLGSGNIIYNADMVRLIATNYAGIEVLTSGSENVGSYTVETLEDGSPIAVITFD